MDLNTFRPDILVGVAVLAVIALRRLGFLHIRTRGSACPACYGRGSYYVDAGQSWQPGGNGNGGQYVRRSKKVKCGCGGGRIRKAVVLLLLAAVVLFFIFGIAGR